MTYSLEFKKSAYKEWKKLEERLDNPHVPNSALSGATNLYKIKLRQVGNRLVYSVDDEVVVVTVHAIVWSNFPKLDKVKPVTCSRKLPDQQLGARKVY